MKYVLQRCSRLRPVFMFVVDQSELKWFLLLWESLNSDLVGGRREKVQTGKGSCINEDYRRTGA